MEEVVTEMLEAQRKREYRKSCWNRNVGRKRGGYKTREKERKKRKGGREEVTSGRYSSENEERT